MAMPETDGTVTGTLLPENYGKGSELKDLNSELNLVVGAARKAEQYISNRQWSLLWRDADLLMQSPRPLTVYENSYVLEPNVQRFTVAKVVNAVVPQLYKGLFYADPPMLMRPRPGTSQDVVDAKTALFSYLLEQCRFKTETKWGIEQMATLGTGIWKWGIEFAEIETVKRVAAVTTISSGPAGAQESTQIPSDVPPKIERKSRFVPRPFFESRPLDKVLVDPKCAVGDIRHADFVIDVRYMDFYALNKIREALAKLPAGHEELKGWELPLGENELRSWWMPPTDAGQPQILSTDGATYSAGVHHSENVNIQVTPDLLMEKKEVLEYWDRGRKILTLDRKKVLFSGKNPFKKVPFFSSNWWNRTKAFYGMGLGLIVGQNQRVDQGTINAILKILSFGVNPVYLRKRDSNQSAQTIRTGLGRIISVDGPSTKDAYSLLETPKVPAEVWAALSESEKATESASGADQALVQGSSSGPRSSMGRTAGGANILAGASATRLDGPLDNFIDQVFKPFLYVLNDLVRDYISDAEIYAILGEEMGKDFTVDLQQFHDAEIEYEVLAGSSMAAKRTMAQSLTLLTQILENPQITSSLAEINGEYIDWKPILGMWMEASEWKDKNDIIKPMTDEMKQQRQQQTQAAQQQTKAAISTQSNAQKAQLKSQLEEQSANNRIKRDLVVAAFRNTAQSEAVSGAPNSTGLTGAMPDVV